MTRFEALQARRCSIRLGAARSAWSEIQATLNTRGIDHELFGSLANGNFREHSDIDLMIRGQLSDADRATVREIVMRASKEAGIDVDLIFEADLTNAAVKALLEQ